MRDATDDQIKADIMYRLLRKHCWGAKYLPLDTIINWIGGHVKKNGKRVRKCIEELAKGGFILMHKKWGTISLNVRMKSDIENYVKRLLKLEE